MLKFVIKEKYYNKKNIFIGHNRRYSRHIDFIRNELSTNKLKKIRITTDGKRLSVLTESVGQSEVNLIENMF